MPEKNTIERAKRDRREGKSATTQAGEFVHEEMEHVKKGKHRVKSRKQAVAIGLSKARRAGVNLAPPKAGSASKKTRKSAAISIIAPTSLASAPLLEKKTLPGARWRTIRSARRPCGSL